ncbi:MAG: YeeE/YedE thiosulfate transporter family protein [Bacteroides sp.]|jgi:rhodanese-related sulfurtransferase|nr:YeeE/YedE thiosulfate transporter family protein [Bacteroides sp.]
MAPFIPEGLINPQLNLFFALVLGIGFGFVLESAGFSSSRKLAGVFFGYDFVVLRVFFTAGITAMIGLLFLGYLGFIDMSLLYINPLYLWSALMGGAIMGVGFILGGYCPGTSVVAAVIGKIDAMLFILGAMIGVFFFGHFYDTFEPIYTGKFLGNVFAYESLGLSRNLFAFIFTVIALLAFVFTQIIEDRVNKVEPDIKKQRPSYVLPAFLLFLLAVIYLVLPSERHSTIRELSPSQLLAEMHDPELFVTPQEVSFRIMTQDKSMILIDVREPEDFQQYALPGAVNIPLNSLFERTWRKFFKENESQLVFYGFGNSAAELAWSAAKRAGTEHIYILQGGLNNLFDYVFNTPIRDERSLNCEENFYQRFVLEARDYFKEGNAIEKNPERSQPVIQTVEIVGGAGGC